MMKIKEIILSNKMFEENLEAIKTFKNPDDPDSTPVMAKNMTKKEMEEYDLYLVIDKKIFGYDIGGTFLVTGMKFKRDGGLEVNVPKTQRYDGKIHIPSNRSGTKFILSKGPDTSPSIPIETYVASSLFHRGINEGKEVFFEGEMSEIHASLPKSWKHPEIVWASTSLKNKSKLILINHDNNKLDFLAQVPVPKMENKFPRISSWEIWNQNGCSKKIEDIKQADEYFKIWDKKN